MSLEKSAYTWTGQILWVLFLDVFYHFSVRQRIIGPWLNRTIFTKIKTNFSNKTVFFAIFVPALSRC